MVAKNVQLHERACGKISLIIISVEFQLQLALLTFYNLSFHVETCILLLPK